MAEGVIADFESVVQPQAKRFDAVIDFAKLVELSFIYKANRWNFLVAQSSQQLRRHFDDFRSGHRVRVAGGKIINRDRNFPWRRSLRAQWESCDQQKQRRQSSTLPRHECPRCK